MIKGFWRRLSERLGKKLANERGFSLVEILGAVTIISVISVTMMGYFTAGLDKSADESRRIIAANLARLKAEEIRESLAGGPDYAAFVAALPSGASRFAGDGAMPFGGRELLAAETINGSVYRFIADFSKEEGGRRAQLAELMEASDPDGYLLRMSVTVYWGDEPPAIPGAAATKAALKSTTVDSYLVKAG